MDASGYEIGFWVLFSIIIVALLVVSGVKLYSKSAELGSSPLIEFVQIFFSLSPYVVFFAGFVIDILSSHYLYSKASLVGLCSVLIIAIFGSDKFANLSKSIVGFLPSLYDATTNKTTWVSVIKFGLVWGILLTAIASPLIGSAASPTFSMGKTGLVTTALSFLIVSTLLAGKDFLGDANATPQTIQQVVEDIVDNTVPTVDEDGIPTVNPFLGGGITLDNFCTTPGLESLQTRFAPVGLLLNSSIIGAHLWESYDTGNNSGLITSSLVLGVSLIIETSILWSKDCFSNYKYGWKSPLISSILGLGFGAAGYYGIKLSSQESFTSSSSQGGVFHPPPAPEKEKKTDSEKLSTKIVVGPQPDTSEPVDDQDAFVCEAYKDGELITSTIVD